MKQSKQRKIQRTTRRIKQTRKQRIVRIQKAGHTDISDKKVAIFFAGRINAYEYNKDRLLQIQKKYNATLFCSLNKVSVTPYIKEFLTTYNIGDSQFNIENTLLPDNLLNEKVDGTNILRMYSSFFHRKRAMELIEKYQITNNMKFDIVLNYRVDIVSDTIIELIVPEQHTVYIPIDQDHGGLNDVLAFGTFESMKTYNLTVDNLYRFNKEKHIKLHPETMNLAQVDETKLNVKRINFNYSLHSARHNTKPEYLAGNSNIYIKNITGSK